MLKKDYDLNRTNRVKSPKGYVTYTNENGQRVTKKRRGQKRYFCYIQERFSDIYCFLIDSMGIPIWKDNFKENNLKFVDKNIDNVRKFLVSLSNENKKSITFSANSIKIH